MKNKVSHKVSKKRNAVRGSVCRGDCQCHGPMISGSAAGQYLSTSCHGQPVSPQRHSI